MPDIYQGDELPYRALVDPDNRRPVDWERRRSLLGALRAGAAPDAETRKLWLIERLLELRARRPEAFAGGYEPLDASPGVCAFLRGREVAVAVAVRPGAESAFRPERGRWVGRPRRGRAGYHGAGAHRSVDSRPPCGSF